MARGGVRKRKAFIPASVRPSREASAGSRETVYSIAGCSSSSGSKASRREPYQRYTPGTGGSRRSTPLSRIGSPSLASGTTGSLNSTHTPPSTFSQGTTPDGPYSATRKASPGRLSGATSSG